MMGFRDMTFCAAVCSTLDCPRQFDERQKAAAQRWWGGPGAPVAFADMSNGCDDFSPAGGVMAPETVGPEPVDSQSMSSPIQRSEPKTCSGSTSNG